MLNHRKLSIIAGVSYLAIFFSAIYANFFALELLINNPVEAVSNNSFHISLGAVAFLVAAVFDVIVAWALYHIYKDNILSTLSTYFRIIHAAIMAAAVVFLLDTITLTDSSSILNKVEQFNNLWLIGLFFFGFHLILLGKIVKEVKIIPNILVLAGVMYILDTGAHFLFANYDVYADVFLMMVAVPAILGEMSFSLWLLFTGFKNKL